MLSHALAYFLYMAVYVVSTIVSLCFDSISDYFYVSWLLVTIFGTASYVCFFLIIWHLGTKDKVKSDDIRSWTAIRTDSEDPDFSVKDTVNIRTFTAFIGGENDNANKLDIEIWSSFIKPDPLTSRCES